MANKDSIMYDVAHSAINSMYVDAVKASLQVKDAKERELIEREVAMYRWELDAMSGADECASQSVIEKAIKYYSPILKERYAAV